MLAKVVVCHTGEQHELVTLPVMTKFVSPENNKPYLTIEDCTEIVFSIALIRDYPKKFNYI